MNHDRIIFVLCFDDWYSVGLHIAAVLITLVACWLTARERRRRVKLQYVDQLIQLLKAYQPPTDVEDEHRPDADGATPAPIRPQI